MFKQNQSKEKMSMNLAEKNRRIAIKALRAEARRKKKLEQEKAKSLTRIKTLSGFVDEVVKLSFENMKQEFVQLGVSLENFTSLQQFLEKRAKSFPNINRYQFLNVLCIDDYWDKCWRERFWFYGREDDERRRTDQLLKKDFERKLKKLFDWCQKEGYDIKANLGYSSGYQFLATVQIGW